MYGCEVDDEDGEYEEGEKKRNGGDEKDYIYSNDSPDFDTDKQKMMMMEIMIMILMTIGAIELPRHSKRNSIQNLGMKSQFYS